MRMNRKFTRPVLSHAQNFVGARGSMRSLMLRKTVRKGNGVPRGRMLKKKLRVRLTMLGLLALLDVEGTIALRTAVLFFLLSHFPVITATFSQFQSRLNIFTMDLGLMHSGMRYVYDRILPA